MGCLVPLDLVRVDRVGSIGTSNPNVQQFCIDAHTVDVVPTAIQFHTIDALKASICQRGADTGTYVWVGWKDSRFKMRDLVTVKFDDSKFVHDEAVG